MQSNHEMDADLSVKNHCKYILLGGFRAGTYVVYARHCVGLTMSIV